MTTPRRSPLRPLLLLTLLCALAWITACQQRPAGAGDAAGSGSSEADTPAEGTDAMDRSKGPTSSRSGLGPATLAFDRFGLVPESGFDEALRAVVEAERAYAADAARDGMKAASLRWMRPDATVFDPEPTDAATSFGAWNESEQPRLTWEPQRIEVSSAGDLAVSTGPYRVESPEGDDAGVGQFFSVWQRDDQGNWRVIADLGTPHPGDVQWPTVAWGRRVEVKSPRATVVPEALPLVEGLEKELAARVAEFGADAALARRATDDIHLLRGGVPPRMGREFLSAEAELGAPEESSVTSELAGAAAAASNDFAAGWGVTTDQHGHRDAFVRVYRREQTRWLVAFDVRVPLVER